MGHSVLNLMKKPRIAMKGIWFMRIIFFLDFILNILRMWPAIAYMLVVDNDDFDCRDYTTAIQIGLNTVVVLDPTIYQLLLLLTVKLFADLQNPRQALL